MALKARRQRLVSGDAELVGSLVTVTSALEMLSACEALLPECDIFIACAAVADYRPSQAAAHKEKKTRDTMTMTLERNPDILMEVSQTERPPFRVGFAAETQKLVEHAREKLERKGLDMIAANRAKTSRPWALAKPSNASSWYFPMAAAKALALRSGPTAESAPSTDTCIAVWAPYLPRTAFASE